MPPLPGADNASIISSNTIASTSVGRSIYPRGPGFSLDTFSSKDFIVKDFVESLSDGATNVNRRSGPHNQAFDPKPYIRAFEHALTRLDALSEERETHETELSSLVRRAEGQHRQHCSTLQRKLDQALESFNSLETRLDSSFDNGPFAGYSIGSGYSNALQIGERLEELDRQKRRAEDAKTLIQCWQDVNERGSLTYLEDVRRMGGGEGKVKCAQIARQLLRISNSLSSNANKSPVNGLHFANGDRSSANGDSAADSRRPNKRTNELIEKFLERLEKDLLEQFEDCKRLHNEHGMRECAAALYDFSDGASVIGRYVNQHEFFLERSHMITEEVSGDGESWDQLADPDAEPPGVEPSLQSLVDEVKFVLEEESFTIKQVFPFHEQVLVTFIQRIFQQSIQQRLELVLEKANSVSSIAFLRSLQAARTYIGGMVEDLKSHGLTEHPDSISPQASACLDQQLEDLFVPYFASSAYADREKRSLEELYSSLLFKFTLYHSKRQKAPTTYLGSLGRRGRELLATARDAYMERLDSSDLPNRQKAMLLRIAGLRDFDSKNKAEIEVSEEDGELSLPVAKRMLKWLAEAVGRDLELSGGSDTPKDIAALLRLLITNLGDIYLDTALDAANETAVSQETSRIEPTLTFLPSSQVAVSILQLTIRISTTILLPLSSSNVTVRREMDKTINQTIVRMEDKLSTLRARTIDAALSWVSKLLARQARSDFRPRDDDLASIEQLQTPTCSAIFAFLSRFRDAALPPSPSTPSFSSLGAGESKKSQNSNIRNNQNAEIFFTDLAVGFRSLLLEHLKKFQVNLAGGLMVSKDITKYIELLRTLPLSQNFLGSLEVLVEVGNIFVIGPEALRERLRGGSALTGVDKADLRPYILRREDAGGIGVQSALGAL